jgi:hypothetical protein
MRATRPARAGTRDSNLSDGRHYKLGGPGSPLGNPSRPKQHPTAPGWGGPGTIGTALPVGSEGLRSRRHHEVALWSAHPAHLSV